MVEIKPLTHKEQLAGRKVKELRKIAREMGIRPEKLRKQQLVNRIDNIVPDLKPIRKRKNKKK